MDVQSLPAVNATLNATCAVLLLSGRWLIARGHIRAHRRTMIAAVITSTVFLASYVFYHAHVGSVPFTPPGAIRFVYFAIFTSNLMPDIHI